MPAPLLALEGLTRRFARVAALDHVSLDIHAGEVHVLLGENGAGKSTLLALLTGRLQPDAGQIRLNGEAVAFRSPLAARQRGIAAVYQHPVLAPALSVAENIALGEGHWWQLRPRRTNARRLEGLRQRYGLQVRTTLPVGSLPLAERQQGELLRALSRPGRILLLDEPTAMLTPAAADRLSGLIAGLAAEGWAVVLVTHRLVEALRGDRISVLRGGQLVGQLGPDRLRGTDAQCLQADLVREMFGSSPAAPARLTRHATAMRVLEAQNLCGPPQDGTPGLQEVSFSVHAGEILGIAGIDGQGQRALADILAGQANAASGHLYLNGKCVDRATVAERRRLGLRYLTDDRLDEGTVAPLSIARNLLLKDIGRPPLWRLGVARRPHIEARARALAQQVGLATPVQRPVAVLSGGNVQRVLLAREMDPEARLLILHKPTYGLDLVATAATHRRILDLASQGAAVLLISTDLDELLALSGRVAVMSAGRLSQSLVNAGDLRATVGRLMAPAL